MLSCHRIFAFCLLLCTLVAGAGSSESSEGIRIGDTTIERTVQLRTHSLYAPYIDQDLQNRWWDFGADAYVNTNKHVRLTRDTPSQMGWLWSRMALAANSFVIEFEFKIKGTGKHLYGDGMALWITKDRAVEGPLWGSKDYFEGVGIFIDTYANSRHGYTFPRVSATLGDGKTSYDFANDGEGQQLGACTANFRRSKVATKLKVTYVKGKLLDVKAQYKGWDQWTDCFTVQNITLPASPYVGFTAMTGDVYDNHDIISVTTSAAVLSSPDNQRGRMPAHKKFRGRITAGGMLSSSSWVGMFTKLFLLAGLCVGGFYGWKEYQRRKIYSGGTSFGGVKTPFSAGGGKFGGMGSAGLVSGLGSGVLSSAGYNNSYDHKRF